MMKPCKWLSVNGVLVALLLSVLSLVGCKPGIPGKYLQPDEMVDILYDYHLAQSIASNPQMQNDTLALRAFRASILAKHGVGEAEFDSSMVYYTRHTKLLEDVYTKLVDRFNSESVALGGASAGINGEFSSSDTTNIWRQSPSFVLSPYAATNRQSFEIKADTAYHAGDRIILDFDAQFIYQDGMRDASVVLAVTYDNDSTEFVNNQVMSSSHYHMQIDNTGRLGIKSVRGFFMLSDGSTMMPASKTTLKLLVVTNVQLVRMHTAEQPNEAQTASPDSLGKAAADSLPSPGGASSASGDAPRPGDRRQPGNLQPIRKMKIQPLAGQPMKRL